MLQIWVVDFNILHNTPYMAKLSSGKTFAVAMQMTTFAVA